MRPLAHPPRATARLQFHPGFTLDDAVATVPYYDALGISHVYASPLLASRSGSTHGYDVVDPTRIDPQLGGIDALRRLVEALRSRRMGLVLDIVPNHMAASIENPWWRDVLEWGRDSRYADFFDIDWEPPDPRLQGRVMVPTLGREHAHLIEDGELDLELDAGEASAVGVNAVARIQVAASGQRFPLAAQAYPRVLGDSPELADLSALFERAKPDAGFDEALAALAAHARDAAGRAALDAALARYSPRTSGGQERLRALLGSQPYLLAPWSQAWHRINWRRFFDVTDLIALRPDRPDVFDATHAFVLELYAQGLVDGLRIDHIDGLIDPRGYCLHLRERLAAVEHRRPAAAPPGPAYLIVEKILSGEEVLREDWQVDGTTGYEFMDQVGALLHDGAGAVALQQLWQGLACDADYEAQVRDARRQMVTENFAADLDSAVRALLALAGSVAGSDASPDEQVLREALVELIVHFPVYRTYAAADRVDPLDVAILQRAADGARPAADEACLGWLVQALAGAFSDQAGEQSASAMRRFQRLTPPIAAKALEDTTFYRYGRLLSRNEVGAEPDAFALEPDAFHALCARRARQTPHTLLATATHDHKRGEDARARLAVLSELPEAWARQVDSWRALNAPRRSRLDSGIEAPDPADEMMLYQTLVGAWPAELEPDDDTGLRELAKRVHEWQQKALREAKRHSSWSAPDTDYEGACERFLDACLSPDDRTFAESLAAFVARVARAGAVNGLTQALLRMTTPGVPDLYQGTELWDHSLVDPDNRRPVDHELRARLLSSPDPWAALLDGWTDGRVKQQLVAHVLALRRRCPALFAKGTYRPLHTGGQTADHVVAFVREHDGQAVAAVATRLALQLLEPASPGLRFARGCWGDTGIALPPGRWRDCLSGGDVNGGDVPIAELLGALPLALLERVDG
jgi:(1->4)-alpha-D-glucan 1-alpha-D-glucosylmutase